MRAGEGGGAGQKGETKREELEIDAHCLVGSTSQARSEFQVLDVGREPPRTVIHPLSRSNELD
jgi:hypothetical protein